MENLGHIISATRVSADPKKIHSMETWPVPSDTTALCGFLGLNGYYQKFIQRYGAIAAPLQAPVLILPDFSKLFVVEADGLGTGLGAVLMREGRPVAYYSKAISGKALGQSTYEKELMAIVHSILQWRNYLLR